MVFWNVHLQMKGALVSHPSSMHTKYFILQRKKHVQPQIIQNPCHIWLFYDICTNSCFVILFVYAIDTCCAIRKLDDGSFRLPFCAVLYLLRWFCVGWHAYFRRTLIGEFHIRNATTVSCWPNGEIDMPTINDAFFATCLPANSKPLKAHRSSNYSTR